MEAEGIHTNGEGARTAAARFLGFHGTEAQEAEAGRERYTELAANGVTKWTEGLHQGEGVKATAPSADWNVLIQTMQNHEVLEFQSLFAAPFKVTAERPVAHFKCTGFGSYFIDPEDGSKPSLGPFAVNPYLGIPKPERALVLEPGNYALRARVRVKYQGSIVCQAWATATTPNGSEAEKLPVPVTASGAFAPDFLEGEGPLGGHAWLSYVVCSIVPSPGKEKIYT